MQSSKLNDLIVTPFISGNYENFQYFNAYSFDYDNKGATIFIHGEKTLFKDNKDNIFAQVSGNENLTIDLLNCIEGITATKTGSKITVNGMEWDGKKTNIQLFID